MRSQKSTKEMIIHLCSTLLRQLEASLVSSNGEDGNHGNSIADFLAVDSGEARRREARAQDSAVDRPERRKRDCARGTRSPAVGPGHGRVGAGPHVSDPTAEGPCPREGAAPSSFGLSATSQQYFSLTTNQLPAISQQYSSLRTNQYQPSATSQTNRPQFGIAAPWTDGGRV
jgi:hypothetical protein